MINVSFNVTSNVPALRTSGDRAAQITPPCSTVAAFQFLATFLPASQNRANLPLGFPNSALRLVKSSFGGGHCRHIGFQLAGDVIQLLLGFFDTCCARVNLVLEGLAF